MSENLTALLERSENRCELCEATSDLSEYPVPMATSPGADGSIIICEKCSQQIKTTELDNKHLYCLQGAAWSATPAVQVVAYRLLTRISGEAWAADLLDQIYLEDDILTWAREGINETDDSEKPRDSNGTILSDGDSVTLIKDLVVKGANFTAKRGTMVKNIRVGDDQTHVEGRVNKVTIMLKTCFLKRA